MSDPRPQTSRSGDWPLTLETMQEPSLPDEAKSVIWRIFGEGASPMTRRSPYELIAPVVKKHLSSTDAERSSPRYAGGSSLTRIDDGSSPTCMNRLQP